MTDLLYGIFGGTFDPIHNGHLKAIAAVSQQCRFECVHLIPSASPPHRSPPHASAQQRLEMVSLATAGLDGYDLDDRELKRDSPSWTCDTVRSLQSDYPDRKFCFVAGMDVLSGLADWYLVDDLINRVHFVVMQRPGWSYPESLPDWWQSGRTTRLNDLMEHRAGKFYEVEIEPVAVSATEIRSAISRGMDVSDMLPIAVWDYIRAHNLYATNLEKPEREAL